MSHGSGDGAVARDEARMKIDELARRTGMTVRNIRAHQSRGLLPPPEVRGRTGYYGEEHLARIELIREMQGEGLNLEAIRRLLEGVGDASSSEVLDFARALRAPFDDEEPEIVSADELAERWGGDPAVARRARKLGLLRDVGGGQIEIASPRLMRAGAELAELGVSAEVAVGVLAKMRRSAEAVARAYVDLFLETVWEPFDRAGRPEEDWPKVREALERLRPLASEALLAVFQMVMTEATEQAFGETLERPSGSARPGRSRRGGRRKTGAGRRGR
jgi:DNA-binding transcriptional MerR regulator